MIVEDFTTRTAGTRVSHRPKIVFVTQAGKPVWIHTDSLNPDVFSLLIRVMNCHPKTFFGKTQPFRQKIPGKPNGIFLEVVAKTEIPKHFKKCVMTSGIPHIF